MKNEGADRNQYVYFWEASSQTGESLKWDDTWDTFEYSDSLNLIGNLTATGTKSFVQNHPEDATKSVVYVALEAKDVGKGLIRVLVMLR